MDFDFGDSAREYAIRPLGPRQSVSNCMRTDWERFAVLSSVVACLFLATVARRYTNDHVAVAFARPAQRCQFIEGLV